MRVTLVTTWGIACGIAEHGFYLKEAIEQADPSIQIEVETNLHPSMVLEPHAGTRVVPDWLFLNYHASLHSQWHPEHVRAAQAQGMKVMLCYHDTGVPNSAQCKALHAVADCFVIHEPAEDLPGAVYIRQGIPALTHSWELDRSYKGPFGGRPIVGTLGFPFPWKNYDLLVKAAELAGWAVLLLAPNATPEQVERWKTLNRYTEVYTGFTHRDTAVACLASCDATAFLYANANTGTSAAIRLGVAARKPVLASHKDTCRQFRDLYYDKIGQAAIQWVGPLNAEEVAWELSTLRPGPFDPGIVRLAHQDSWSKAGTVYAKLLRGEAL